MRAIKILPVIFIVTALAARPAAAEQNSAPEQGAAPEESAAKGPRFDYNSMRQDELMQIMNVLETQVATLKKNQAKYKRDVNPEYEEIQNKIDELQGEREAAYKKLSERWRESD